MAVCAQYSVQQTWMTATELSFADVYNAALKENGWSPDPAHLAVLPSLHELQQQLKQRYRGLKRLLGRSLTPPGIYLWGGVGRGKTWLIDLFLCHCEEVEVKRFHYHQFMAFCHDALTRLESQANPLETLAGDMAEEARLLFIDEFAVKDITDAMLLGGLLQALVREGVTLCISSNLHPDQLYKGGLQRERFLPAISLLKHHTNVVEMTGDKDFRAQALKAFEHYHFPLDDLAEEKMLEEFRQLAGHQYQENVELNVMQRKVIARYQSAKLAWFDFQALCGPPRSQRDYLDLASRFSTLFISNVPQLTAETDDVARRFVMLVDELYDRKVKLMMSMQVPPEQLYVGTRLSFEFERTVSRLNEMQGDAYQALSHRV